MYQDGTEYYEGTSTAVINHKFVIERHKAGVPNAQIAREAQCSRKGVIRIIDRWNALGNPDNYDQDWCYHYPPYMLIKKDAYIVQRKLSSEEKESIPGLVNVFGYEVVARMLGVSATTIFRHNNPDYKKKCRDYSHVRDWKK